MKPKKPDRIVSEMDVLKDIRGLLSTTRGREAPTEAPLKDEGGSRADTARFKEEIRRCRELIQEQQKELGRVKSENEELAAKLKALGSAKEKSVPPEAGKPGEEITRLEARKDELSLALSQLDGLLQVSMKELLKRIARLYQEAGGSDMALEFRRTGDQLETAENLAHFVRALLK